MPSFPEDDLKAAFEKFMKCKALPSLDIRPAVVDYARKQNLYQLMLEDYDSALRIDEAIDSLLNSLHDDQSNNDCEQQEQNFREKFALAESMQKELTEEWSQRIAKFKERENRKLEELEQRHQQERSDFEASWLRPEALLSFNKPSVGLLQIRQMQKSLAISHHFVLAKQLKMSADQQQKDETFAASRRAQETMRAAFAILIRKQEKEMECFMENGRRQLTQLEADRDARIKANENMRNQLEIRAKWPKHARRPIVTVPQVASRPESRAAMAGLVSVRTRSQFATFKKSPEKTRLEVTLGDIKRITKPMTPSPSKGKRGPAVFE
jgi:hypothetical protein